MTDTDTVDGITETFEAEQPRSLTQREIDREIAELLALTLSELIRSVSSDYAIGMIPLRERIEKLKERLAQD